MKTNFKIFIVLLSLFAVSCGNKKQSGILFQDDFSNPATLKSNWIIHDAKNNTQGPSEWVVEEGKLLQKSNIYRGGDKEYDFFEGTSAVTKKGKDWKNYSYTVDYKIMGDDDGVGVLFRYQDPEHFYRFITVEDPGNQGPFRKLQAKDGDKYITLAENKKGYDSSKPHKIKITVKGDEIKVFFDGKETLSAKDSRYKKGKIGLMSYAEQPAFDNVSILSLD